MSETTILSIDSIVSNPKIRRGRPIIAGTTLMVQDVVAAYLHKGYSMEEMLSYYPQLSHAQIYAALAYYYAHKDEIDASLAADDLFYQQMRSQNLE